MCEKQKNIKVTFTVLLLAVIGCGKKDLPEYSRLEGLRVLTLVASSPEVNPGSTVTITPVVSDINGAGRSLSFVAQACLDPGVGFGAKPSCSDSTSLVSLGSGSFTLAAPSYTAAGTTFNVTVPSTVLLGRTNADQFNGVPYLVTYRISASDGSKVDAFKRILVTSTSKVTKNANPGTLTALLSGVALSSLPSATASLSASVSGTAEESFSYQDGNGNYIPQNEELVTTWFATDGSFNKTRTVKDQTTDFTPAATAPSSHSTVIALIVRDGRGGTSYRIYSF